MIDAPTTGLVDRLRAGDAAPPFTLPGPDEVPILVEYGGHEATVVVFTSNGCPYALAWHDRLQDLARDYDGRGVRLVQILCNDETAQPLDSFGRMRERVRKAEVEGDYVKDTDQVVARSFGALATPEVFVVDRSGTIRYHGMPDANYDDPALRAGFVRDALDAILVDGEVTRTDTPAAGCSIKWRVALLWWDGCPSHPEAAAMLERIVARLERTDVVITPVRVRSQEEAVARGFPGSPTLQIGGRDVYPADAPAALGCRIYQRPDGRFAPLPDEVDLEGRLREILARPWELPGWVEFRPEQRAGA